MNVQKKLTALATLSLLGFMVACNSGGGGSKKSDRYAEGVADGKEQGYAQGYDVGYKDGYADGDVAGYERAKAYFASADYLTGFSDGKAEGITVGYSQGYDDGNKDGLALGYTNGYNAGYNDGDNDGYNRGYGNGYNDGFDDAEVVTYQNAYLDGYDDGAADGYELGYDDGFDDGYGLSVGKTKSLKGYANLLSMFHNDVIDYSKIKAPVQTKRGLVANGQLLLSENSFTNKDTLKKVAVVEQYLVVEMAKQVQGKFGLSADRSLKVAKFSNHFRKNSERGLTAEDTQAYATEAIGSDFHTVSAAYEQGLKGDLSAFNEVMAKAAEKNETSPEKMNEIFSQLFL